MQLFRPNISEDAIKAVTRVLRSGWIGLGPVVEKFEKEFASYVGAKYAVALNSGTAALHLALIVSSIGEGDEVITTPLTFVSTNHVILYQRAVPVFADVHPRTYCMSPGSVEKLITEKTKAVVCVHYGGHPCNLSELYRIAADYNLKIIEDAGHACGSFYRGRRIGSFGLTCFSFHAVKNLPTGDGGMITTDDWGQCQRLKRLRWLGIDKDTYSRDQGQYLWEYSVPEVGFKYHMNDITAAIGREQLKLVDRHNIYRRKLAEVYHNGLSHPDVISLPYTSTEVTTSQHLYVIQVRRREALIAKLKSFGISTGVHYTPNNTFPMYRKFRADTETVDRLSETLLSLPMHTLLTHKDIRQVISIINEGW